MTAVIVFSSFGIQANGDNLKDYNTELELNDGIIGFWEYHVPGVDPMYQNGIMHISNEEGAYAVNLHLGESVVPTEDVEVNENEVKFALYVEGQRVEVVVLIDGDSITGSGTTDQGPFTLSGTRKADPE